MNPIRAIATIVPDDAGQIQYKSSDGAFCFQSSTLPKMPPGDGNQSRLAHLVDDAVASGDVFELCRFLELNLVLQRREPHRLVGLGLGHDDHAAVPVEDTKRLLVGHPSRHLFGK